MGQIYLILSGNGGTGKTTLTAALATAILQKGRNCCCVELSAFSSCLDLLLDFDSEPEEKRLKHVIPPKEKREETIKNLQAWKKHYDYVLVDVPIVLSKRILPYLEAADRFLLVVQPNAFSIRGARGLLSFLQEKNPLPASLVVNRIHPQWVRRSLELSPQEVSRELQCPLMGFISEDEETARGWRAGVSLINGRKEIQRSFNRVCKRFLGEYVPMPSLLPRTVSQAYTAKEVDECSITQDTQKHISI